jgi:hypothetical protein
VSEDRDPALRASDADRDAVADQLRGAHAEGRLTVEELYERLDVALAARTLAELAPLTADLPVPSRAPARTGDEPVAGRSVAHRDGPSGLRLAWGAWLSVVLVNVAVWGAVSVGTGDAVYFWPVWVAAPWGALLLARTLRGRW